MWTIVQAHFQYPPTCQKCQLHLLTGGVYFFFNPVNKNPKCIRKSSEISEMSPTSEKSEMHQKCIRNNHFLPPDQFLNIFCFLHIHPQLLHLILNSHISAPPTHPKIINFVKCKWLPNKID